ncbi:Lanthionine synthetase C-like protein [Nannocystis exedens]|uniref:Lanthionine synthetase C-like protein n=1 Tax=Nannocystis exedens TaxID=54 RepID=A0A1I2GPN3_9BACT|nr:lanthionine synthetase C family protein [Nannocystis exedens]PCC68743.1 Lanthionine synthetase C-like protein [Nannocystis exedens]SFF19555.1 Lanthionine synthetase C-like protein [Nannocystis exedens]
MVRQIADALRAAPSEGLDAAIDAEHAVLFAHLAEAWPAQGYEDEALQYVERATRSGAHGQRGAALFGGLTGVGWAIDLLHGRLFEADGDPNAAVDALLMRTVARSPWTAPYDLISGLVGIGVYALQRLPRESAATILAQVVARLGETAEPRDEGITWRTRREWRPNRNPGGPIEDPGYDLGVAHGVPGVIALLGAVCAAGIEVPRARALLDGAVAWTLAQRLPPGSESVFPYSTRPGERGEAARLAWCYGDAGIAVALWSAAHAVHQPSWTRDALAIARQGASRLDGAHDVRDAGICHGAAGLGHLYNRLFQATGDEVFRDTARAWFARALAMQRPDAGIAGYLSFHAGTDSWDKDSSFLTGVNGIALALLAAATPCAPLWDGRILAALPIDT